MQKEFEERKQNMNELFEKKRDKKRERRKKRVFNKKMVKKLSKLAEGVNKYNVNGNYVEEFKKEVEMKPNLLLVDNNAQKNFDEFDYNTENPKDIKKFLRPKIKEENQEINEDETKNFLFENNDKEIEDDQDYKDMEESSDFEDYNDNEKVNEETVKIKELSKNIIIYDNDL